MEVATAPTIDFKIAFRDLVAGLLILEPKIRAVVAAERLIKEADAELLSGLGHILLVNHIAKLVRAERQMQLSARDREQLQLPGFEHVPRRISISPGAKIPLAEARVSDLDLYLKFLRKGHRDRQKNDGKILEVQGLLKLMRKHARRHKGITYGQVFKIEAEKAANKERVRTGNLG